MAEIDDIRAADAQYQPFPAFEDWQGLISQIDTERWEEYTKRLGGNVDVRPEVLNRAQQVAKRAAAVETGAIEGLYDVDRGFTFTVATEAATWEAALAARKEEVRSLIEAQLRAYDYVLDFVTEREPISEAWIRELHRQICAGQSTYQAVTEAGVQSLELPKGEYKSLPNHVRTAEGGIHSYAPVDLTASEMHRLCSELQSDEFQAAHPLLQASYAHYALVAIHPFADGNGRVARALASVYTYRSARIPILIFSEHRREYFAALARADEGDGGLFAEFIGQRTLDAMLLVEQSIRTATAPQLEAQAARLRRLFRTRGGYSHGEVDSAGARLRSAAKKEFTDQLTELRGRIGDQELTFQFSDASSSHIPIGDDYRVPVKGPNVLKLRLATSSPADAQVDSEYYVQVPVDCGVEDDLILSNGSPSGMVTARMDELLPDLRPSIWMRVRMWVEQMLGEAMVKLAADAEESLGKKGY